ncbi:MAG: OsmC family protein [Bacteroidales bacterium]
MTLQKLETQTTLVNDRVQFSGKARNNPSVQMDYFPPIGGGEGYTGLEMLLLSLSGCSCTAIKVLLQKMNKTVEGLTVNASGIRQEAAPFAFSRIDLVYTLSSPDVCIADLEKAIHLAETSMCPVWAMLKGSVEIVENHLLIKT